MAHVVFMRGVNVGGHKTFRPAVLARDMASLDAVNIGAAGTFVVRGNISEANLRAEFLRRLPFKPDIMICPSRAVAELVDSDPFKDAAVPPEAKRFLTVVQKPIRKRPEMPIDMPAGRAWEVRILAIRGLFIMSLWRRMGKGVLYPNEVVEKTFGIPATTRNWNTLTAIRQILGP